MMKPVINVTMKSSLRRLGVAAIPALLLLAASCSMRDREAIVLSAPFGPLAYPFIYMAEHQDSAAYGRRFELKIWNNPDQLRAMVAGGQADFFALPTNVAAIFHNKGVDLRLVNVSVWSVFWMVSTDSTKTTLASFRGEKIVVPFRGDMPHIIFENLARHEGLDPAMDMRLRFAGTPQEVVQQLLTGAADHAVLAEPDISILMYRSREMGGNSGRAR
ncbi:MAG: ABC transporter substrate-binding protein, partial [Candidatus Latescibacteria bacterium]|nr:ABC transporter substrate-binding protein [Candidatus Latescibacterota bacterium]